MKTKHYIRRCMLFYQSKIEYKVSLTGLILIIHMSIRKSIVESMVLKIPDSVQEESNWDIMIF